MEYAVRISLLLCLVSAQSAAPQEWPRPSELRSKKLIDAGIYTLWSSPSAVHTRLLAERPEFTTAHPFDGIALRALLDPVWCREQGLKHDPADPPANQEPFLDSLAWSTKKISATAVDAAIADLGRVQWGTLTDNFLWYQFRDGGGAWPVDITRRQDWDTVKHNAAMAARICRMGKLKGLLFDTEQYGYSPLKQGTPELRRKLGREWMEAVQQEFPGIRVMITFAWSNDLDQAAILAGVKDFLNGMLEGLVKPGVLINAYENTFYYGQAPKTRFTASGFPGDRKRYESARTAIRAWRSLSSMPSKYDSMVQVGMAAWLESDPWNLTPGWPSAHAYTIWSNVGMALAVCDEYTWCWSEHTDYLRTVGAELRNPFLASLTNQTFNTGREAVTQLREEFGSDPLARGWYFDFDMLDVGRRPPGSERPLIFDRQAVPYMWSAADRAVRVSGDWRSGDDGSERLTVGSQRRRFVHPISAVGNAGGWRAEIDFQIDSIGAHPANPIVLGLFHSGQPLSHQSLLLRIAAADTVALVVAGQTVQHTVPVDCALVSGRSYRLTLVYDGAARELIVQLADPARGQSLWQSPRIGVADLGEWRMDEVGVAQWEVLDTPVPDQPYRYLLQAVRLKSGESE